MLVLITRVGVPMCKIRFSTNELLDLHGPIDGQRMVARRSANWRPHLLGDRCDNMVLVMLARLLLVTGCALVRIR